MGAESTALPEGVQRVVTFLQDSASAHNVVMLDAAARTAQQAAEALNVELGQIAKSIVFRRKSDDQAVMVVTSGDRRVDEKKLEALVCPDGKKLEALVCPDGKKLEALVCPDGKKLGRADAAFVKARTGFSIGGVSPVAHAGDVVLLIDRSLLRFDEVWAAAGHPHAVFSLVPQALELLTGAPVVDVAVDLDDDTVSRQNAIDLLAARALQISATSDIVPSPCISVCRIAVGTGLCEGCFRTLAEISGWSRSVPDDKRRLWQLIQQRASAAPA